jgi:hypothetical protein
MILHDIAENMNWMGDKLLHFVSFFNSKPCLFNTIVGAEAVGAGAVGATAGAGVASRYGSGSDQMMRLHVAPAPQHWLG